MFLSSSVIIRKGSSHRFPSWASSNPKWPKIPTTFLTKTIKRRSSLSWFSQAKLTSILRQIGGWPRRIINSKTLIWASTLFIAWSRSQAYKDARSNLSLSTSSTTRPSTAWTTTRIATSWSWETAKGRFSCTTSRSRRQMTWLSGPTLQKKERSSQFHRVSPFSQRRRTILKLKRLWCSKEPSNSMRESFPWSLRKSKKKKTKKLLSLNSRSLRMTMGTTIMTIPAQRMNPIKVKRRRVAPKKIKVWIP